jgi:multimeric flavodoxin WrbA
MRVLILNGSPRPNGNTKQMIRAFCEGLEKVTDIDGNRFRYVTKISNNNSEQYTYNGITVDLVWRFLDEDRKTSLKTTTIAP